MPADDAKIEQLRSRESGGMPSITQDAPREPRPAVPTFSYAQAAKGKVPSVPAPSPPTKAISDTSESSSKKDTNAELGRTLPDSKDTAGKQATTDTVKSLSSDLKILGESTPQEGVTGNGILKEPGSTVESTAIPSDPDVAPTAPSPIPALESALPVTKDKDDGMVPAVNGSAESAWDRHSQSSQNESKQGEKAHAAKDGAQNNAEGSWDEEKPEIAALKEAPPPPVNFWAQRMAQPAKGKVQQSTPIQASKPVALSNGNAFAGESSKLSEAGGETRKQESKKRSKVNPEDRPVMREGAKSVDGKAKNGEGILPDDAYKRLHADLNRQQQDKHQHHSCASTSPWGCYLLADARLRNR